MGGEADTFYYNWNENCYNSSSLCKHHACHGCEVSFIFGNPERFSPENISEFMKQSQFYWANFAKYGNPNTFSEYQDWMHYDSSWFGTRNTMWLDHDNVYGKNDADSSTI